MNDFILEESLTVAPLVEEISGGVVVNAPAKINLNLLVGPLRPDGFHPLDSFAAKITLYDRIELRLRNDGEVRLTCELSPRLAHLGADIGSVEKNLAYRAAGLLRDYALKRGQSPTCGADIHLLKRIPPGMGLGGGSSDAAGTLLGLSKLWNLGLSDAESHDLGTHLGSDVPLFLQPSLAIRMTGRGEILQPIQVRPFHAVLCLPPVATPTGPVYREFDRLAGSGTSDPTVIAASSPLSSLNWSDRTQTRSCASADMSQLPVHCLEGPPSTWPDLRNDLLAPALNVSPALRDLIADLAAQAGRPPQLTGSGSGLFFLCNDELAARQLASRLHETHRDLCILLRGASQM